MAKELKLVTIVNNVYTIFLLLMEFGFSFAHWSNTTDS
ncbi:hypothetical protein C7972_109186 [Arenibacter sp. ARW7G5Y1]|nr:hypothetical protein C7972_109186 [Arenibacter sp. ARW7G5Y1]